MERADIAAMAESIREAFLSAGDGIREKRTVTGRAFLVEDRAIGQTDVRAGTLRTRIWLPDKERRAFESRPTFDLDSGWLHLVSDDDIQFVRNILPVAYRAVRAGTALPSGTRSVGPESETAAAGEKKRGASRRPPSRSIRPRG